MEFHDYWKQVTRKYPAFKNEGNRISISVKSLKDFMKQAHERGAEGTEEETVEETEANKFSLPSWFGPWMRR